jgi:DNA-binding response OmpR family regulator
MNILIVEDEVDLASEISDFLSNEGFLCETAHTGMLASEKIAINLYDFVLLDLGLPDYNGLDLITEARSNNNDVSFIIITARGAIEDKIEGLNLGADDYLSKPFSLLELLSRINAVARRKFGLIKDRINVGEFIMQPYARRLICNDSEVHLSKREFDLLQYLVLNQNKVLSRQELYEHIWGNSLDDEYDSNFIDVHIKDIRKKLGAHAPVTWLETVRGIGYRVTTDLNIKPDQK